VVRQFRRDPRSLALVLLAPLVVMGLLSYLLRLTSPSPKLAVIYQGFGLSDFSDYFPRAIRDEGMSAKVFEGDDTLVAGLKNRYDAILVLPMDFLALAADGQAPEAKLLLIGNPLDASRLVLSFRAGFNKALAGFPVLVPEDCPEKCLQTVATNPPKITPEFLGLASSSGQEYFAWPVVPLFPFFMAFVFTSLFFLRERGQGTLERLLATPTSSGAIVSGYGLGLGFFAVIQLLIVIVFVRYGLGLKAGGSWMLAGVTLALALIVAVLLGVALSTFARAEIQVAQFVPLIILPQVLLGDIFWPVAAMPGWLKGIAYVLPLTHSSQAMRAVMVRGETLASIWPNLAVLAAMGIIFLLLAMLSVRRGYEK
jgi:ABC-2 type transport system permease protein